MAYNYVKSKKGDPYVVIAMSVTVILTASARPELELGLDTITPLSRFAQDPQVVAVRTESKFKTFKELVDAGAKEPGSIVAGVTGPTGSGRAALYLIEKETGAKFRFVNFKGGGDAVLATLGGYVELTTENMSEMMPLMEAKKMRILAVTGERRFKNVPDVPTLKELGYNIFLATGRGWAMPPARAEGRRRDHGSGAEAGPRQSRPTRNMRIATCSRTRTSAAPSSRSSSSSSARSTIEFLKHIGVAK